MKWINQNGDGAYGFGGVVHYRFQPFLAFIRFDEVPGRGVIDIFIGGVDQFPNRHQDFIVGKIIIKTGDIPDHLLRFGDEIIVIFRKLTQLWHLIIEVTFHHVNGTVEQVAEVIGKVAVLPPNECLVGKITVQSKGHFAQ